MNLISIRRFVALLTLAFAAIVLLTTSCADETLPLKGQLMLVITTNMAPPKDFDTMHLRIVEEGSTVPIHDLDYALGGSQAVKLPATLGVVAGSDPNKTVRITVEARRAGVVRVTREAIARVPQGRVATLPLPIDGLCVDRADACPADPKGNVQTCIAGKCQTANVDVETLPDFSQTEVFGGGTGQGDGTCFDTLACFTNGKPAVFASMGDCSIEREAQSGFGLNVAVVRPPASDGICGSNACLLPLDRDPFTGPLVTGWREMGGRVILPPAICERSLPVLVTTSCTTKNAPTCGAWSATGSARDLGDASIPFDSAAFAVDGGGLSPFPDGVGFLDEDPRLGFVAGTVTIKPATDESTVTGYNLYWGDGGDKKLGPRIATLPKTGADVTHVLSAGPVFPGATHLVAFSTTAGGELMPGVSAGPIDNYPRSSTITAGNVDFAQPLLRVDRGDPNNPNLLIVGFDKNPARSTPALVRCKIDGSDCTYVDISASEMASAPWQLGAAVDEVNKKLLVVSDNGGTAPPRLFRCNSDGSACTKRDLGTTPLFFSFTGCEIPVLVDTTNQKLLAVVTTQLGNTTLLRCDLDGTNCTTQTISQGTNICPRALISSTDSKLLVVQRSNADQRPSLHRCGLDGTNCQLLDLSGGTTPVVSALSAAIDPTNQKLVVVSSETNQPTLYVYRCNVDGTGCVGGDLGLPNDSFIGPSNPALVVDDNRHHLFVFGYGGSRGFYQRCNIDGTGCTHTATSPPASSRGTFPNVLLHDGQLFAASPAFGVTGIDLITLFAY